MIGAILFLDPEAPESKFIYHRFADFAIAEHTCKAYVKAEQIQKIILAVPQSERKYISGTSVQPTLMAKDKLSIHKKIEVEYFIESEDPITFAHQIAITHGLDHIVIGNLSSGLIPSWLINDVVYEYFVNGAAITSSDGTEESYENYFKISVMPFWKLARLASHSENRCIEEMHDHLLFKQNEENSIVRCNQGLVFKNLNQSTLMEYLYRESSRGADISDIIREINDK